MKKETGIFCEVFGDNPQNRILEFFISLRELDHSVGDMARELDLNKATAYNVMGRLIKRKIVLKSREVSGAQLYKLNTELPEVKIMIIAFNKALEIILNENSEKQKVKLILSQ